MNTERDRLRRKKAAAILSRPAPDRRAVKRARRLLKDANRDNRIRSNEAWNRAMQEFGVGLAEFGRALNRVTVNVAAAAAAFGTRLRPVSDESDALRRMMLMPPIAILPPGDEIQMVPMIKRGEQFVSFPMRRTGKTAVQDKEIAELEARGIKVYRISDLASRPTLSSSVRDFLDLRDIDEHNPMVKAMQKRVSERLERSLFAHALGETYAPPPRCKCGVMLYGDSCLTCGFEANETKQSD